MAYAENTSVSSESSRMELERTVRRYGADQFAYMTRSGQAVIGFVADGRQVRFTLPLPDPKERRFTHSPAKGLERAPKAAEEAYEQAVRQKWRALNLVVKAKLEAVEAGIVTFDEEFLAHLVLPGGARVFDEVMPQVERAYETSSAPLLQIGAR